MFTILFKILIFKTGGIIMLLSIIVPFYNPMPYLKNLLDSLSCQDLNEVEMIFIDDGSNDEFRTVLDPFLNKNSSAKLISYHGNKGVSYARNVGIKNAIGQYIWFVDSDDQIELSSVSVIKSKLEYYCNNKYPDIIFANYKIFDDTNNTYYDVNFQYDKYSDCFYDPKNLDIDKMDLLFSKINSPFSIWYQLFNREFIHRNNVIFNEELIASEDIDYKMITLLYAKHIDFMTDCIYIYRLPNIKRKSLSFVEHTEEDIVPILDMLVKWYRFFANIEDIKCGDIHMMQKFAFLVHMHYKYLKKISQSQKVIEYIKINNNCMSEIYEQNKVIIDEAINILHKN